MNNLSASLISVAFAASFSCWAFGEDEPRLYAWTRKNGKVLCWFQLDPSAEFDRKKLVTYELDESESKEIIRVSNKILISAIAASDPDFMSLNGDQKKELKRIGDEFENDFKAFAGKIYLEKSTAERKSLIDDFVGRHENKVQDVLLPHQLKAMARIRAERQVMIDGFVKALSYSYLSKELKITDSQKKRLKSKADELQKKFESEIDELILKAREKMYSVLTPEQKQRLKKLTGPPAESNKFRENAHKNWLDF